MNTKSVCWKERTFKNYKLAIDKKHAWDELGYWFLPFSDEGWTIGSFQADLFICDWICTSFLCFIANEVLLCSFVFVFVFFILEKNAWLNIREPKVCFRLLILLFRVSGLTVYFRRWWGLEPFRLLWFTFSLPWFNISLREREYMCNSVQSLLCFVHNVHSCVLRGPMFADIETGSGTFNRST